MSGFKRCEVCGGVVSPLDEQSNFGSCEHCGIVYALNRARERRAEEEAGELGGLEEGRRAEADDSSLPSGREGEAPAFRWRCPDCDAVLTADSESDLGFLRKEHIRELHPNRPVS